MEDLQKLVLFYYFTGQTGVVVLSVFKVDILFKILCSTKSILLKSSKFDEFLAGRSQFDSDHDQIWQACADRSGNGSYLNKLAHEWPGRVGSISPLNFK